MIVLEKVKYEKATCFSAFSPHFPSVKFYKKWCEYFLQFEAGHYCEIRNDLFSGGSGYKRIKCCSGCGYIKIHFIRFWLAVLFMKTFPFWPTWFQPPFIFDSRTEA